ncbi:hypothetical protein vBSlqSZDD2_16 [Serratia phage vB_SlqS_ZDD2]|nr:hypothetical protein vBSlqSZDD2_16 [Serratia phage vB_SlqS_ZDD2]
MANNIRVEFTPEVIAAIQEMASKGLTDSQIAEAMGIARSTFVKKKQLIPGVAEALSKGRAVGIEKVASALFKKATSGDTTAIMFFLRCRDGQNWNDKREIDVNLGKKQIVSAIDEVMDLAEKEDQEPEDEQQQVHSAGNESAEDFSDEDYE